MKKLLVTGCGGAASLNFVDSLRASGDEYQLFGTDTNRYYIEMADVSARYLVKRCNEDGYLDQINHVIEKHGIQMLHAQPDPEVAFFSENRDKVKAKIFLPDKETVRICHDKVRTNEVLAKNGVGTPRSVHLKDEQGLKDALKELSSDKNPKVWLRATRGAGSRGALPITNATQAIGWINYWQDQKGIGFSDFMACEFLPGEEYAFQSLWKDGELLTSMARRRVEYMFGGIMPSGQTSSPSVALTVHEEDVNEVATQAVLAIDRKATGVFCVDIKRNVDNKPMVTEINIGRFFTTSNFFARIGVNMPHWYVKLAMGEELPKLKRYNAADAGIYWIRSVDYKPIQRREGEWKAAKL